MREASVERAADSRPQVRYRMAALLDSADLPDMVAGVGMVHLAHVGVRSPLPDVSAVMHVLSTPRHPLPEREAAASDVVAAGGAVLSAVLRGHRDLPDASLAALARAAFDPAHPDSSKVPLAPHELVRTMGAESAASLIVRLGGVRVRWADERPPRYMKGGPYGLARLTAARFLVERGSEARWLLSSGCPESARTALMLPADHIQDLDETECLQALSQASCGDMSLVRDMVTTTADLEDEARMNLVGLLLDTRLSLQERAVATSLARSWELPPSELPKVVRALALD